MQTVAGLSVLLFILVGTAVGVRMLALARRTGGRPERLMGLGLVLVCALGYPGSLFSGFGKGTIGEVSVPLWALASLLTQIGIASIWLFTGAVFRPGVPWARALIGAGVAAMIASYLGTGAVLLTAPADASCNDATRAWLLVGMVGYAGSFLWSAVEGLLQRRMALGGHRDAEDTGELPGHPCHAAFQPVATLFGDALRQFFHQSRLVGSDDRQYQMIHAEPLCRRVGESLGHPDGQREPVGMEEPSSQVRRRLGAENRRIRSSGSAGVARPTGLGNSRQ
jgi:hypothetical protein